MSATRMEDLTSDRALVCRQEVVNEQGPGTIWHVLLSDGHLLECGDAQERCPLARLSAGGARP